jgi:hypothetical protein
LNGGVFGLERELPAIDSEAAISRLFAERGVGGVREEGHQRKLKIFNLRPGNIEAVGAQDCEGWQEKKEPRAWERYIISISNLKFEF